VESANVSNGDVLANEVAINLNMLGVLMLDWVSGEVDHANIVVVDQSGPRQEAMQLQKQLTEPTRLRHAVGYCAVLRLNTRTRDDVVALRGSGDEVVA
jgi:hypothetical protein